MVLAQGAWVGCFKRSLTLHSHKSFGVGYSSLSEGSRNSGLRGHISASAVSSWLLEGQGVQGSFAERNGVETGAMVVNDLNQQQRPDGITNHHCCEIEGLSLQKRQNQNCRENCTVTGHLRKRLHRSSGWQLSTGKRHKAQRYCFMKLPTSTEGLV